MHRLNSNKKVAGRPLRRLVLRLRSVSRVSRVLGRPAGARRLARRRFGPSPFRRTGSRETSTRRPNAAYGQCRRGDGRAKAAPHARSGEGTARPGGAVARSSRVIAAGEATAQAIGPVPVAHPAVWTPGLCGSGVPSVPRIGTLQRPGHVPRETPPHTETLSRVTCVGRSRRGKSADRPEAERAGPESARR